MTERGTLLLHPDYGSNLLKMIGEKYYDGWEQKVMVEIVKTMLSDPRVDSVENMTFDKLKLGIHIKCVLVTPLGLIDFSEYIGGASQ
jgi:phage baseplate assembly protein W